MVDFSCATESKTCTKCGTVKTFCEFPVRKDRPSGRGSWCKLCVSKATTKLQTPEYRRAYRKRDPEKFKGYALKNLYGISLSEWNSIFEAQGRRCAICKTDTQGAKGWSTDHNHKTNKVRGILCGKCNSILGYSQESVRVLYSAIDYLETNRSELTTFKPLPSVSGKQIQFYTYPEGS